MDFRRNLARLFVLTMIITLAAYHNQADAEFLVQDGLVSFWSFDADTFKGNKIRDVFGANDCTAVKTPVQSPGKVGEALNFDGTKDGATCGNRKSLANIFDGGWYIYGLGICKIAGAERSRQNRRQESVGTDASQGRPWHSCIYPC